MEPQKKSPKYYIGLISKGFCMGAADVVPGVSGGTMAFILGIYTQLINAIRSFDTEFIKLLISGKIKEAMDHVSMKFLISIGSGILIAVFSLAEILSWLLENKPVLIWSFFFGLILASVVIVSKSIKNWNGTIISCTVIGATGAYFLVCAVPVSTPDAPWFLFICGAVAICAMILPGISGSFILVLMGKYQYILEAVNNRDILTLAIVAAGAGIGILSFARLLNWLLKKYNDQTIAILTGLMLGSLRKVWPWKETLETIVDRHGDIVPLIQKNICPPQWDIEFLGAVILIITGLTSVLLLNFWSQKLSQND